ncbi:hypothetical protein BC827DRAFT_1162727 [Russula dissimulans]|nr:hypothetical protein BC827DRAFT_1162727 [Russula dissimulans]
MSVGGWVALGLLINLDWCSLILTRLINEELTYLQMPPDLQRASITRDAKLLHRVSEHTAACSESTGLAILLLTFPRLSTYPFHGPGPPRSSSSSSFIVPTRGVTRKRQNGSSPATAS